MTSYTVLHMLFWANTSILLNLYWRQTVQQKVKNTENTFLTGFNNKLILHWTFYIKAE